MSSTRSSAWNSACFVRLDPAHRRARGRVRRRGRRRRGRRRAARWRAPACSRPRPRSRASGSVAARARSCRAARVRPSRRATAASFQPRSTASPMPVLSPWPPNGGLRCAASPARNTRRSRAWSTSCIRAVQGSCDRTSGVDRGSPAAASMIACASRRPRSASTPNAMIHQVPARSSGPISAGAVGLTVQYWTARAVAHHRPELGRVEDHAEVRAQRVLADVGRADRVADDAARAVAADHVVGGDRRHTHRGRRRSRRGPRPSSCSRPTTRRPVASVHRRELADDVAQQLLEHVLRRLLAELGIAVAVGGEAEHAMKARELAARRATCRRRFRSTTTPAAGRARAAARRSPSAAGAPWCAR